MYTKNFVLADLLCFCQENYKCCVLFTLQKFVTGIVSSMNSFGLLIPVACFHTILNDLSEMYKVRGTYQPKNTHQHRLQEQFLNRRER